MTSRRYDYPCKTNTSCYPITVELRSGFYMFEAFGARGGSQIRDGIVYEGGKGGYAKMFYTVQHPIEVYLYIGGSGSYSDEIYNTKEGGWNGGGDSGQCGASGGGATDIRLVSGYWDSETGLKSRIIVAGGGSGGYGGATNRGNGGDGGGETGEVSTVSSDDKAIVCIAGQKGCIGGDDSSTKGTLGKGGSCPKIDDNTYTAGAGGGYYGGGCGKRAASGGSGYVGNRINSELVTGKNTENGYIVITSFLCISCQGKSNTDILLTLVSPITTSKIF